ncbi:uncharacterized protein LOC132739511 [Ruditapes philippinarum]|uniref:uncharacterized protein LOC132739511 n=1 Tax=Ruditapes philippinarum TaxID=129788 RepID=UPI00295B5C28|nr:uncharacterized protein LOC132739511 [Ruditapes philippinarum]
MDSYLFTGLCILSFPVLSDALAVYGFQGASSAILTGRTLHYSVHLNDCELLGGPRAGAEFEETFGGHITIWRSFNDRDISDEPFLVFFDQRMLFDEAGKLAQLVREVEVWGNDTGIVRSVTYSTDYSKVISETSHKCSLSSANKSGNIDFQASEGTPDRLNSFEDVLSALESGRYVHFQAMTFICRGGREHSFSNFGGHIPNYEMKMEGGAVHGVRSSVQQTVHYVPKIDRHVRDVINLRIFDNRTVEIIDVRGGALYEDLVHEHISYCTLETGMPGGTFNAFAS